MRKLKSTTKGEVYGVDVETIASILEKNNATVCRHACGFIVELDGTTTELMVFPPPEGMHDIQAVVRVSSRLPNQLKSILVRKDGVEKLNAMASLGAVTTANFGRHAHDALYRDIDHLKRDPLEWMESITTADIKYLVDSRLTIYVEDDAWDIHLPLLLASVFYSVEAIVGSMRASSISRANRRSSSDWSARDLKQVNDCLQGISFCNLDLHGFTAEFSLEPGAVSAGMGHKTALLRLSTEEPHALYGAGLFCALTMPQTFDSPNDLRAVVEKLNVWESEIIDAPPHFGAWCQSKNRRHPTYICFLPNELHAIPGIAVNLAIWQSHRASAADAVIEEHIKASIENSHLNPKRAPTVDTSPEQVRPHSTTSAQDASQALASRNSTLIRLVRAEVGYGLLDDKLLAMANYLIDQLASKNGAYTSQFLENVIQATRRTYPSVLFSELERVVAELRKKKFI